MKQKRIYTILNYLLLIAGGIVMVYPLVWLFFASFKGNSEIFSTAKLLPDEFSLDGYINGWKGSGQYTFGTYYINTFKMVIPMVLFMVFSCALVAFGFARFRFPLKKPLFLLMISTLMLPNSVMLISRYIMFRQMNWLDTYLPFTVPAIFAGSPFFIFMLIQFFRGLPKELDESAYMDGCGSLRLFVSIFMPLSKPALFSAALFQLMWAWNDFFQPLIYISSVKKYTLALGLRMAIDSNSGVAWNNVLAMAFVSVFPLVLVFFFAQKYFVEGIATTGLKG